MKGAKILVIILAVVIVALLGVLAFVHPAQIPTTTNTDDAPSTNQIVFSPDGSVGISAPEMDSVVTSPVNITGQANGRWFFEATFPIKILDADGTVLGQGPAQATGEWMTTGTVPFEATITFIAPKFATGTIVFTKDDPSGLAKNAETFSVPISFK